MKVIIGMSGGVDSSVSAFLLKQQGYDVEALFMKNWNETENDDNCVWEKDVEDALKVCEKLKIPINTIDLSEDYWGQVFTSMIKDFEAGLTPNPDILCNQEIKFTAFMNHAINLGAEKIATGHYARIQESNNSFTLKKGTDDNKDQSYFLCRLTQQQLSRAIFPIGDMNKDTVRQMAKDIGFSIYNKKDSTGICFIGERPFKEFLSKYIPIKPGFIKTLEGVVLGTHDGVYFYTIGQRHGLGIGGIQGGSNTPWYVVNKDISSNTLYVIQGNKSPELYSLGLTARNIHWIENNTPKYPVECAAKTRYRQPDQTCLITKQSDDAIQVLFKTPQKAIAPGQYVVFYDHDRCLGGGIITSAIN